MVKQQERQQVGAGKPAPAQALAIEHASGPIQVLAGPGSGKTYLTIRRIRHLICHHGISPNKILVITFTKAAALEMEERFYTLTDRQYEGVRFGTFHAIYFHILKNSGYGGGKFTLAAAQEKRNCLNHVLQMHGFKDTDKELPGALLKEISRQKNSSIKIEAGDAGKREMGSRNIKAGDAGKREMGSGSTEEEKIWHAFPVIFKEYCGLMEEMGKLDFDDMIFLCDRMFAERRDIREYWQSTFSHILVDEFQDISPLQYRVLKQLAAPENNLFVVGDDDQSIYGFRGAGPDIMRQFMEDYPEALQLTLDTNYRSAKHIVQSSLLLIANNRNRFAKKIRAAQEENGHVVLRAFQEKEEEAQHLIGMIKNMAQEEQEHTAIICRTNIQLSGFSRSLAREHIPFCCKERIENLFSHEIAKDFLAYLQYAHGTYHNSCHNSYHNACSAPANGYHGLGHDAAHSVYNSYHGSVHNVNFRSDIHGSEYTHNFADITENRRGTRRDFLRIMNKPCRYIQRCALDGGDCSEQALRDFYRQKPYMQDILGRFFTDLKTIAKLRPYLAIDYIRKKIGYDIYLCEGKSIRERQKLLETADEIQQTASKNRTLEEWVHDINVYSEQLEESAHGKKGTEKGIQLVTMHGSKGLEYDTVFLPQVSAKLIPSRKAHTAEELEEERRIFYVAMTRAKYRLEISYYKEPSPFLSKWVDSPYVTKEVW